VDCKRSKRPSELRFLKNNKMLRFEYNVITGINYWFEPVVKSTQRVNMKKGQKSKQVLHHS
jgi:hypothetical protein